MNTLKDVIGMGGGLFEEAYNIGRREALKEVNGGKCEMLEEANRNLGAQIDNYERNRYEASKEIDRLTEQVRQLNAESDLMDTTIENLRKKLEDAEAKIKEQNEALAAYREPTPAACPFCGGRPDVTVSWSCSVCGCKFNFHEDDTDGAPYCPNCGAKMDEAEP